VRQETEDRIGELCALDIGFVAGDVFGHKPHNRSIALRWGKKYLAMERSYGGRAEQTLTTLA
jgi:hypothetical protein